MHQVELVDALIDVDNDIGFPAPLFVALAHLSGPGEVPTVLIPAAVG